MALLVKICGLSTPETLEAAIAAGADMVGFVFFPPSPRHLSLDRARELGALVSGRAQKVALTVDADDDAHAAIAAALAPDWLQLHGAETPARVAELRQRFGRPVLKAIGVSSAADLARVDAYEGAADMILLDAKPPKDATRPGGNAQAFDWTIPRQAEIALPWMLSGGLGPDTVAEAIRVSGARGVDVSSGVESSPGVKDAGLIAAFCRRARAAA
jgi:phosphoribosylanthranilate isomerase